MNTKILITALLALLVGAAGGYAAGKNGVGGTELHRMPDGTMMHGDTVGMDKAMHGMMADLEGKTGDEFDQAFLSGMIIHHEGAVKMAEAALESAKHPELIQMAQAIISAQAKEIEQMKEWQRLWYGN